MPAIGSLYDASSGYDLVGLRYVQAISACGNMTEAARRLRVSQPTLSVAVRSLEQRLGTSLFHRRPRGVVPTASGLALVRAAEGVFALLRQADSEVRGVESAPAGRFVLGCYHSFGVVFLPPMMRVLQRRAPAIELALWEGTGPDVRQAVVSGTVHFGVDAGLGPHPHPELVIVPMFHDAMVVMRSRRHPHVTGPIFHVARIASSQRIVAALRARGVAMRDVAVGDLELVKSLIVHGAGIGVLPLRVATHGVARGTLELVDPSLPHEVEVAALFHRADLHRTRGATIVRDAILSRGAALDASALLLRIGRVGKPRRRS
jgi:DNA-binding transcriptional LysR family regulator